MLVERLGDEIHPYCVPCKVALEKNSLGDDVENDVNMKEIETFK